MAGRCHCCCTRMEVLGHRPRLTRAVPGLRPVDPASQPVRACSEHTNLARVTDCVRPRPRLARDAAGALPVDPVCQCRRVCIKHVSISCRRGTKANHCRIIAETLPNHCRIIAESPPISSQLPRKREMQSFIIVVIIMVFIRIHFGPSKMHWPHWWPSLASALAAPQDTYIGWRTALAAPLLASSQMQRTAQPTKKQIQDAHRLPAMALIR